MHVTSLLWVLVVLVLFVTLDLFSNIGCLLGVICFWNVLLNVQFVGMKWFAFNIHACCTGAHGHNACLVAEILLSVGGISCCLHSLPDPILHV